MGKFYIKDPVVTVNGVNFSDHVSQAEITLVKDELDTTNFSGGGRERMAGLKDDSFVLNFQQDFAAAQVAATLLSPAFATGGRRRRTPVTSLPGRRRAVSSSTGRSSTGARSERRSSARSASRCCSSRRWASGWGGTSTSRRTPPSTG